MRFPQINNVALIVMLSLVGCVQTSVSNLSIEGEGLYVVAYTDDMRVRIRMEEQLVTDLATYGIVAVPSFLDFDNITEAPHQRVINTATEKKLLGIIVLNEVAADGSGSIVQNPNRVSPLHPTLQNYYEYSKSVVTEPISNSEAFAEVNLFALNEGAATLYWYGTTWAFNVDNQGGAIRNISFTISEQLADLKKKVLGQ